MRTFAGMGADITFIEAPLDENQMRAYCAAVRGPKMANLVEQGDSPLLPPARLHACMHALEYKIIIYPATPAPVAISAMEQTLKAMQAGQPPRALADFAHLREIVGVP